jgi:putative transposase
LGPVAVRQPRVRDREANAADPNRIPFSVILRPTCAGLKGIWTGDFSEALAALLRMLARLSASAIGRLKDDWLNQHTAWQKRDMASKRYVKCILVLIGASREFRKELVIFTDGARESAQDWRDRRPEFG